MSPSEAVEHAIVFSNLRADGPAPRFAPLRRALAAAPAAAQGELILAGGTFVGAGADEGALTALGDKALLSEVAQNMNLVSLFRGKEAGDILKEVVGGTRFAPALQEALSGPKPAAPKK